MKLIRQSQPVQQVATVAQVSFSHGGSFGAVGAVEHRSVPVFSPGGISYLPCEGDNLLVMPVDGIDVCVGVLSQDCSISPGELRFCSKGGAEMYLKNNGDVVINGVTITKSGEIVPKK